MISLAEEEGYIFLRDLGRMWKGWSVFSQGLCEEGLSLMLDAFATYQHEDRVNDKRIYNILVLASAYRKLKRYSDGLQLVEELMALVEKTGMRSMESDVYRLKGELLRESDGLKADEAQRCFEQAIDIAHQQSGKSNELMATTSLARLLAQQGRCNEARAMLAEIYNWFTEGFDTLPLQEARVLLDNLNEKSRRASH
jgi:tetratricopeptide (TPR) repeat protein